MMNKEIRNYELNWDCVVITSSNDNQANCFLRQIDYRKSIGLIDKDVKFLVIPDKNNKRVGSGGSTFSVIKRLKEEYKNYNEKRFLVIHAGGDSKRCPQYSAIGKLFSPIPSSIDNKPISLFDLLLMYTAPLSSKKKDGMFLLSGDVVLLFDGDNCELSNDDAMAISFKENVLTAKNHGVYLADDNSYVGSFLHKQDEDTLNSCGAVDINNNCNIDTGIIYLGVPVLNKLEELVHSDEDYERLVNDKVRLSLYGDIEYCLASESDLDNYYKQAPEGDYCEELKLAREELWNKISSFNMKLISVSNGKFIHFGSISEILSLMNSGINKYKSIGWSNNVFSSTNSGISAYNSVVDDSCKTGKNVYIENSYIHGNAIIGNNCYISNSEISNITIPDNLLVHCLKLRNDKYVCRIMDINDNPKDNSIFNTDIDELINTYQLKDVFDGDSHSLWNANLYPESDTMQEAIKSSLYVYDVLKGKQSNVLFNNSYRKSLCSGFNDADISSILKWNSKLTSLVKMHKLDKLIRNNKSVLEVDNIGIDDVDTDWINKKVNELNQNNLDDFSYLIRLYYYLGYALNDDAYIDKCFKLISDVIVNNTLNNLEYNDKCKIINDKTVVKLPLRVNFGGGWSDTPPHCLEHGGTVINAAIDLNGQLPVEVILERIDEKKIIFESKDMNVYGEFTEIEKLQDVGDPLDPYALQKACLLACGIIPKSGGNLNEILDRLGGGFILNTNVYDVPKGSGLGTSSILAAGCVEAIFKFMSFEYDENKLCSTVLAVEQIISTGGGWQDQIGGITNGVKFITSTSGINQDVNIEHLQLSDHIKQQFNERYCIIYSGKQRLAKNILRDVVGRYVGNIKESIDAHIKIQEVAVQMKKTLLDDRFDEFAGLLDYHWDLSKQIDAGSSNTHIESIFACIDDLIDAKMIIGAGGGGFLQVILRKGINRKDIQDRIDEEFRDDSIKVYNANIVF